VSHSTRRPQPAFCRVPRAEPGRQHLHHPWRHRRELGGFILDMAVHFTHMIRYQLGDDEEVYGDVRMVEPV